MPEQAVELLADLLKPSDRCLEWGSGDSTTWLRRRSRSVVSIEHDPAWFERVRGQLAAQGLDPGSVRLLATEPEQQATVSPYVRVVDEFADGEIDICVVDGEHRAACALAAVPKLSSGGLMVIDDAQGFLDHRSSSLHSRWGKGPLSADWGRFAELVSPWRLIWVGDGFSDAAIWIKP